MWRERAPGLILLKTAFLLSSGPLLRTLLTRTDHPGRQNRFGDGIARLLLFTEEES